ncbi:MAG TPA: RsmE family RNA methyltransferase [Terriglobales bacterium]|jgi:16S rRNA (uracil1498-N3)-methyltransferase|nr:RsmE family RNA methyltransferase [Terriglobales bacterium]
MTRRRWIADEVSGSRAALVGANAEHLARVLRARIGQEFDIAAEGRVRRGRIVSITPEKVEFELGEELAAAALPEIALVLAVFKFDRMEWGIEKAIELGVARLLPLVAKRTDSHLASAAVKRVERWRRIAREAAQQSRRVTPPEIVAPVRLREILDFAADRRIVLSEGEDQVLLRQAVAGSRGTLALAIGPEGGWTSDEERAFREHGWIAASLGPTILRAETAAIAAISIVLAELR